MVKLSWGCDGRLRKAALSHPEMAECSPGQFQFLLTGPPERAAMPGLALNHSSWQADTPGAGKARVVPSHSHPSGHPLIPILRTPQDFLTLAVTFPNNKLDTPDEVPRSSRSSSHHPWCFLACCWLLCDPGWDILSPILPAAPAARGIPSSPMGSRSRGRHPNMQGCSKMLQKPPSLKHWLSWYHWNKSTQCDTASITLLQCSNKETKLSLPPDSPVLLHSGLLDASPSFHLPGWLCVFQKLDEPFAQGHSPWIQRSSLPTHKHLLPPFLLQQTPGWNRWQVHEKNIIPVLWELEGKGGLPAPAANKKWWLCWSCSLGNPLRPHGVSNGNRSAGLAGQAGAGQEGNSERSETTGVSQYTSPKNREEQVNRHTWAASQALAESESPCASHPAGERCPEREPSEQGLLWGLCLLALL